MNVKNLTCLCLVVVFGLASPAVGQLIEFQDRNEFDLFCPDTSFEDFDDIGFNIIEAIIEFVVDSNTMNGSLDPGEITEGIRLRTNLPEGGSEFGFVLLDTITPTGGAIGAGVFAQGMVFDFPTPVDCLGFDLYVPALANGSGGVFEIAFFDQNNSIIGSQNVFVDFTQAVFVGVAAENGTVISRMEVVSEVNDENGEPMGEVVDNIAFRLVETCESALGDINGDDVVSLLDVSPFVNLIASQGFQCEADMNQDGAVDLLDVSMFIELLTGN